MTIKDDIEVMLGNVLGLLRAEFPGSGVYEARFEIRIGTRTDLNSSFADDWNQTWITVQVGNERTCASTVEEAVAELRKRMTFNKERPDRAARIAAILREIPKEGFERTQTMMAAQSMLETSR